MAIRPYKTITDQLEPGDLVVLSDDEAEVVAVGVVLGVALHAFSLNEGEVLISADHGDAVFYWLRGAEQQFDAITDMDRTRIAERWTVLPPDSTCPPLTLPE